MLVWIGRTGFRGFLGDMLEIKNHEPKKMLRTTQRRRRYAAEINRAITIFKWRNEQQIGGSGRGRRSRRNGCGVVEGVVEANGFRYPYRCEEHDDGILMFYGGQRRPCFGLFIEPNKTAELHDFVRVTNCSLDPDATIQSAGRAAFKLAAERGVTYIRLTDNASKTLPSGKKFSVSTMEFLTSARSWYETFLPIQPLPEDVDKIERNRHLARTNSWDAVFACLMSRRPEIVIPVPVDDIDTATQGSAMVVFQRIKEARTDFFADYGEDLVLCSGLYPLHHRTWIAYL
jgi:hypothetical protein